jgi:hypothetical protein
MMDAFGFDVRLPMGVLAIQFRPHVHGPWQAVQTAHASN